MHPVVLSGVAKHYRMGQVDVPALADIGLEIRANRFTVLAGPSGSGKTTLLNLIGGLDRPSAGQVCIDGADLSTLADDALSDFRARRVGFVFQNFNLLPVLSALENVEYSLILARRPQAERRARARELLAAVGLDDKMHHRPNQLSGGQRQRVAVARALAMRPALVLADEPTANLDSHTGAAIIALMRQMQREHRISFVFSSHDPQVLAAADDAVHLRDGAITHVERRTEDAA
ncbi:ABC transporter ATP-binding protein [Chitiniphilus purpureus]|uniref:ABC transporter ATP-binding protein n=1 Tax=Chitiniphilus purpureus TaxID=2981137 RepID=A0ABY6DQV1_9NEIS|nr:ABC transporter ATP-binding protein [Chitiniphilus sp. CD1]UXY16608.1 ABC transporter ATP-binding protein [Chitiniphilus sp. CD1]